MTTPKVAATYTTVAFSGAGHLLAYHLGVALKLQQHFYTNHISSTPPSSQTTSTIALPPLRAVSGSSSGAIAAAVMSRLPHHRLEEYADRFLQDRGHAFRNFQEMLLEEQKDNTGDHHQPQNPDLYVCVTKSHDGTPHLLPFPVNHANAEQQPQESQRKGLLKAIEASCRIPVSFHPLDLFQASNVSYEGEGIEIDGSYYVDGGVSGIFPPPIGMDSSTQHYQHHHRLLVCPLEIGPLPQTMSTDHNNKNGSNTTIHNHVISPNYYKTETAFSFSFLPTLRTRDGIAIQRPLQNLQTLVVAGGFTSREVLESWYQRGQDDAEERLLDIMQE